MEDQGKRLILAVALAMGVMLAMSWLFPAEEPKPEAKPAPAEKAAAPAPTPAAPVTPPAELGPEQELVLENGHVRAVFTSHGGALKSWRLLDPKYRGDDNSGEMVAQPAGAGVASLSTSFVPGSTFALPAKVQWRGEKLSETEVRYRYSDANLDVTKTFTYYPAQYLIRLVVETTPKTGEARQQLSVAGFAFQDPSIEIKTGMGRTPRDWRGSCLVGEEIVETPAAELKGEKVNTGGVGWAGFTHPYMLIAMAGKVAAGEALTCRRAPVAGSPGLLESDLVWPAQVAKPGEPLRHEVVAYLGPKFYDKLEASSTTVGFPTQFDLAVDFGWFGFIGKPLLWLLQHFYALVGNWGIAIILLTFLVKLATLYWTQKSMRSMQSMAELKPKIDELQKKYSDDRQRMQTEMMALYKTHGVNPLAGCLPILLQMPIWLALYQMLSSVGELYHAPFIPGWLEDLTATDPYYILPVVLILAMFGQAKLSPAAVDSTQQKILMYGMPLMFGVMGFFFPSGLSVYILTNTVLSALHTLYMRKTKKTPVAPAAAVAVSAGTAPAKAEADAAAAGDDDGDAAKGGKTPGGRNAGRGNKRRRR